jgi:parvulin-like peptidyl-prolyl isomerase
MKRDLLIAVIVVLAVAALSYGLWSMHRGTWNPTLSHPFNTASGPASGKSTGPDTVVMHVNGEPVTEREFAMFGASLPQQAQMYMQTAEGRKLIAQQYARMKVLEQEGKRLGSDDDAEVAAKMRFGRTNVAVEYAVKKLGEKTTDQTLKAEYEKNKKDFETVDLSHIVIGYQGSQIPSKSKTPPTREQALKIAQQILERLRSGGPFEQAAEAVSDDQQSAQNGGRIGPVQIAQLPPEIQAVVAKLKPGEISAPVATAFGVHIFKLDDRRAPSFDEVKPTLQQRVAQTTVQKEVERLEKGSKIDYDPKFFPPAPAPPAAPKAKAATPHS